MSSNIISEYNRDQLITIQAIQKACERLSQLEIEELKRSFDSYLHFREELEAYQARYLACICQKSCFETRLSACCSFESIITFFADHVISYLLSESQEISDVIRVLKGPNHSVKCVYLGKDGCILKIRPISCAMFLCSQAKKEVLERDPRAEALYEELREQEKDYTWPTKPILFNDLEAYFIRLGVESPHLFFHKSPGLRRLKAESGLNG